MYKRQVLYSFSVQKVWSETNHKVVQPKWYLQQWMIYLFPYTGTTWMMPIITVITTATIPVWSRLSRTIIMSPIGDRNWIATCTEGKWRYSLCQMNYEMQEWPRSSPCRNHFQEQLLWQGLSLPHQSTQPHQGLLQCQTDCDFSKVQLHGHSDRWMPHCTCILL